MNHGVFAGLGPGASGDLSASACDRPAERPRALHLRLLSGA